MKTTRRQFLGIGIGSVACWSFSEGWLRAASSVKKKLPIGLQLYAVRGEFARDVPRTLKQIREMGYEGVEFWGYGGTPNVYRNYSARELRQMLDDNGLKCCGMHLQLNALSADRLKRTVENNQVLGNRYLIVAAAQEKMGSEATIKELASLLNGAAAECWPHQMRVGYHAHGFDFQKIDGRFAWDLLFSYTVPDVVMQMDVGNCLGGGGDPIASLKKFPGRAQTFHLKEYEAKTFRSEYYEEIFQLCETVSGTQWYIVEMGGSDGNGFEVSRQAMADLRRLGK